MQRAGRGEIDHRREMDGGMDGWMERKQTKMRPRPGESSRKLRGLFTRSLDVRLDEHRRMYAQADRNAIVRAVLLPHVALSRGLRRSHRWVEVRREQALLVLDAHRRRVEVAHRRVLARCASAAVTARRSRARAR